MINKKNILKELGQMILLFALSVIFVYISPFTYVKHVSFLVPLVLFYRSKRDYFWIAYFFILINAPTYLFAVQTQDAQFALPYYGISKGFSFTVFDLFLFIGLFKVLKIKPRKKLILNKPLVLFGLYLLIVTIPVSFVLGTSMDLFANKLRAIFYYFLVVVLLNLIKNKEDLIKFGYMVSPFVILILADQLLFLTTGNRIIYNFDNSLSLDIRNSITGAARGITTGVFINFYAFVFGIQINRVKSMELYKNLGVIFMLLAFSSFFLSATRAWIVIGLIIFLVMIYFSKKRVGLLFKLSFVLSLLLVILFATNLINHDIINNVLVRMDILSNMINGGTKNVDTYQDRIVNDIPKVMAGIKQSPLLGVGLSNIYDKSYSNDVGYINTILLWGYMGFVLFIIYLGRLLINTFSIIKSSQSDNLTMNVGISLFSALIAMIFAYFFTQDFFSFYPHKIFFIALMFSGMEMLYQERKQIDVSTNTKA